MDPETEALIHQLQLEDARESLVQHAWSGGGFGDTTVAFDAYRQDAEHALREKEDRFVATKLTGISDQELEDHLAALKLLQDEQASRGGVLVAVKEENRDITDHELARRLGDIEEANAGEENGVEERFEINEVAGLRSKMKTFKLYNELREDALDWTYPEFSNKDKQTPAEAQEEKHAVCCSCLEAKPKLQTITTICNHTYCRHCLLDLFKSSMTDAELFPPRCCRQYIALDDASIFFTDTFIYEFKAKSIELSTPSPTYCSKVHSSRSHRCRRRCVPVLPEWDLHELQRTVSRRSLPTRSRCPDAHGYGRQNKVGNGATIAGQWWSWVLAVTT